MGGSPGRASAQRGGTVHAVGGWEGSRPSAQSVSPCLLTFTSWRKGSLMKLALVTIVTANLEPMRAFYQAVLRSSPRYIVATMLHLPWRLAPRPVAPVRMCGVDRCAAGAANDRVLIELEVADVAGVRAAQRPRSRVGPS